MHARVAGLERKNRWTLAEQAGEVQVFLLSLK
jgi:hypothetical protein